MADEVKQPNAVGIRVFVYGSLKQHQGNHALLKGAELLGRAKITGKYQLLDLKWYPGLVLDPTAEDSRNIVGEVYRISKEQLDTLDMLEGHPDYYARHKVQTPWKGAWCYFLPHEYLEAAQPVATYEGNVQVWRPTDEEVQWLKTA